jgi:hypothetical protein
MLDRQFLPAALQVPAILLEPHFGSRSFVIAGLDPAIYLLGKKMDPRVKPAGDDFVNPAVRA